MKLRLDEKENKRSKLPIFMCLFTLFWIIGFVLGGDFQDMKRVEIIAFFIPMIIILCISVFLFVFFRKQIVDIRVIDDKLLFVDGAGKKYYISPSVGIKVEDTGTSYLFYIEEKKKLSAYKAMPFDFIEHKNKMESIVEAIIAEGYVTRKWSPLKK